MRASRVALLLVPVVLIPALLYSSVRQVGLSGGADGRFTSQHAVVRYLEDTTAALLPHAADPPSVAPPIAASPPPAVAASAAAAASAPPPPAAAAAAADGTPPPLPKWMQPENLSLIHI